MIQLKSIPHDLEWQPEPVRWTVDASALEARAAARTDLFTDPFGQSSADSAAMLVFNTTEDFMLSAHVTVDFEGTFDAGVLVVYQHESSWAKLCFEFSPEKQPMIVSVVTKGTSDDCNSTVIDGNSVYLRVSKIGEVFAFHASDDARSWRMVRVFKLEAGSVRAGFLVQSPVGEGCSVRFSEIRYAAQRLADIRSGV